jgi:hypothetical protein
MKDLYFSQELLQMARTSSRTVHHYVREENEREVWTNTDIRAATHPGLDVVPNANVIGKFLLLNPHLDAIGPVEVSAKMAGSSQQSLVPLNLPRFNRADICGQ